MIKLVIINEPATEQCGRFTERGIYQTCKRYRIREETISKTRTADAYRIGAIPLIDRIAI